MSTWLPEPTSIDKLTHQNRSIQLSWPPELIHLDGSTWPPELKSRRFDLAARAKSTTGADKSRWVDLAARTDKSRQVDASKRVHSAESTRLEGLLGHQCRYV